MEGGVDPKPLHEQEADMGRAALRAMYCGEREREVQPGRRKEVRRGVRGGGGEWSGGFGEEEEEGHGSGVGAAGVEWKKDEGGTRCTM